MNALQRSNASAFSRAQARWENMEPDCDDGADEYITENAELLMQANDAPGLAEFFAFAESADEIIASADDSEFAVVQIVLALLRGDAGCASKLAERFDSVLTKLAREMIINGMD